MGTLSADDLKYRVGIGVGDDLRRFARGQLGMTWIGKRPLFEYLRHDKHRFVRIHPYFYRRLIRELWVAGEITRTRVEEILRQS